MWSRLDLDSLSKRDTFKLHLIASIHRYIVFMVWYMEMGVNWVVIQNKEKVIFAGELL